jgi:hypothetical protein
MRCTVACARIIGSSSKTIEQLEETIRAFDGRIEAALEPFRDAIERLKEVPGLSETSVQILIAEIGADMRQFPPAGYLLSWAGLIPRYQDLGANHFARRNPTVPASGARPASEKAPYGSSLYVNVPGPPRTAAKLANRIRNLGFHVEIRPAA